jgi:acyl-CoA synthetase (AMP-forming)/AMP-acid ligase II
MNRFDAAECLSLIERYGVTHAQFVPTMFVRMLQLPEEVRKGFDVSSLRCVIHAAAPCPVSIKKQIIDWFGPIVWEYYSGTEDIGGTAIDSLTWLDHPGSVGLANAGNTVHILNDADDELSAGQQGRIFIEGGDRYEYHGEPEKTASIESRQGWRTLGDIGYLDEEGYLFLTDRATNMIVSGGVNIYPQEIENLLTSFKGIADVAVIGVPNAEFGEEVRAVVQPANGITPGPEFAQQIIEYCRENLAHFKCPRAVDFVEELPREPNGKLYKRRLREIYWSEHDSRIV